MSLQKIIQVLKKLLQGLRPSTRNRSPLINLLTKPDDGPPNNIPPGQPPPDGSLTDDDKIAGDGGVTQPKPNRNRSLPMDCKKLLPPHWKTHRGNRVRLLHNRAKTIRMLLVITLMSTIHRCKARPTHHPSRRKETNLKQVATPTRVATSTKEKGSRRGKIRVG